MKKKNFSFFHTAFMVRNRRNLLPVKVVAILLAFVAGGLYIT
jgi:hypothetical protein